MRRSLYLFLLLLLSPPILASGTLRDAIERAWERQPAAQARPARTEEFTAKQEAARAAFPEPPSLSVGNRNDRLTGKDGLLEWETEIALPLWLPGERERQGAIVNAERDQYDTGLTAAKLKIAGEVRDAYWQARLAENELALARRKVQEAVALAADVVRRVKAGDLARVDLNQAQAVAQLARAGVAEAEVKAFRAQQAFAVLTGVSTLPGGEEVSAPAGAALDEHPLLAPSQRAIVTTQARLSHATQNLRSNPELALGVRRERQLFDEAYHNSLSVRFRLPFATDARNKPRIAAANAELIEAHTVYSLERAKVAAEAETARRELEQARTVSGLTEARYTLATDTQRLLAKAFALGELDLIARLRAENERFEAELQFTRAKLEAARAISRLNQALGVLP